MSERESSGITVRPGSWFARSAVLRWILASATLAALVFALPGSSRAQSEQSRGYLHGDTDGNGKARGRASRACGAIRGKGSTGRN